MAHGEHDLEDLEKRAGEHELVAQRTPNYGTWLKNELRAAELRRRIETLRQRLAKLKRDHPEE